MSTRSSSELHSRHWEHGPSFPLLIGWPGVSPDQDSCRGRGVICGSYPRHTRKATWIPPSSSTRFNLLDHLLNKQLSAHLPSEHSRPKPHRDRPFPPFRSNCITICSPSTPVSRLRRNSNVATHKPSTSKSRTTIESSHAPRDRGFKNPAGKASACPSCTFKKAVIHRESQRGAFGAR